MQVKKNLLVEDRKAMLARFDKRDFKRVAVVVMGEPPAQFKAKVHAVMLDGKKKKAVEAAVKRKTEASDRKKVEEAESKKKEKEDGDSAMDEKKDSGDNEDNKAEESKEAATEK